MTAVTDWDVVDPRSTDAELVCGCVAGDRAAFAQIYDRYADRLHDFCVGMLRDCDGAADCVQDAFCTAATRLPQLREPDKLRPWLYSIARNEALRRLRERRRETPTEELPDIQSDDADPETLAARTELADLIAQAAGGLSDRDHAVFELAFRQGLNGPDLADALGVSHSNANTMVQRLRRTIERSLGALLVSRRAQSTPSACTELREILAGWDGQFTVLMRKRISRHIESCPVCDDERRRLVSPAALLGAAPIFIPAPAWLRERTLSEVQLTSHGSLMEGEADDANVSSGDGSGAALADGSGARRRNRNWMVAAVLFLAVLGASAGLTFIWLNPGPVSITPTDISGQTATPSKSPPTPPTEPAAKVLPPSQAPAQTPAVVTPADPPPADEEPPVFEATPELLPPDPPAPPDPVPPEEPSLERSAPPGIPPPSKPPMSFRPTLVVPPYVPPPGGDSDSDSDSPNRPGTRP
jgi:RNA polymerase sigma factor (sigma-70 family)